jgi:periplasmic protein TonB
MLHLTRCFSVSFMLHLTIATALIFMASREVQHPPKAIMVNLDFLEAPQLPEVAAFQDQIRPDVRPVVRASQMPVVPTAAPAAPRPEPAPTGQISHQFLPAAPLVQRQTPPAAPQLSLPTRSPDPSQARVVPTTAPERTQPVSANPVGHTAPPAAAELRPAPEKAQQRYLKEHFGYIRDLVTRKLIYPPLARKMNWSGKAVVSFTITEDGSIQTVRVVETSGYPVLDKSALETVRGAAPFPKPPVRAEIVLPINFQLM